MRFAAYEKREERSTRRNCVIGSIGRRRLPKYRIRTGNMDALEHWHQGSYAELFNAESFCAAKDEVDRALNVNEIKATENGQFILLDGPDGAARRSMRGSNQWKAVAIGEDGKTRQNYANQLISRMARFFSEA